MEWNNLKDMPDNPGEYLVYIPEFDSFDIARYDGSTFYNMTDFGSKYHMDASHWMRLPTRPKKGYNPLDHFDTFWNKYNKKSDLKKCKARFARLKEKEVDKILDTVENYVLENNVKKYRKNPLTYLNGECWNDEINISIEVKKSREEYLIEFRGHSDGYLKQLAGVGNTIALEVLGERGIEIS